MSRQLLRVCRSIPLGKLKQGGTLSIQSKFPNTRVHVIPEWRDDGHISLTQWLPVADKEAALTVTHEADKLTSLGRTESHMSVQISPQERLAEHETLLESAITAVDRSLDAVSESKIITDDGIIQADSEKWHGPGVRRVEYNDGITHVSTETPSPPHEPSLTLIATVPEKVNLSCELIEGGDIAIDKKVEGDVHLLTSDGNVRVNKLRGHDIRISARGTIVATNLLEAQTLDIETSGRFRVKRIHGTNMQIQVEQDDVNLPSFDSDDVDDEGSLIDISSLYVTGSGTANLFVSSAAPPEKRAVRVKSHHGHVAVEACVPMREEGENQEPCVELGGVNGSFDVLIQNASEAPYTGDLVGRVHVDSLSADSVSVLTADAGDVSITLDRKVEADLRIVSSSAVSSFDARTSLSDDDDPEGLLSALQKLDTASVKESGESRIRIETDAFTDRQQDKNAYQNIDYVDGWVENKSNEPDSRFDLKTKGGKIRLEGAAKQALQGFSSELQGTDVARPLVAIATNGNISVESLSWFGAIARRYGLDEERDDLGRTASRSGRPLVPKE